MFSFRIHSDYDGGDTNNEKTKSAYRLIIFTFIRPFAHQHPSMRRRLVWYFDYKNKI